MNRLMPLLLILAAIYFSNQYSHAQTLSVPVSITAESNQLLRVKVNTSGIHKYKLIMEGNPVNSRLENDEFLWTPGFGEEKDYVVRFTLLDSANRRISDALMLIHPDRSALTPYLTFSQHLSDTVEVVENSLYFFTASLRSRIGTDARLLTPYFLFNEDASLLSFDSCKVTRMGDQVSFQWVPSKREALNKFAKLRITIIDSDKSIGMKVINFKIKEVNQAPYFRHAIPDTVFFSEAQDLRLDFSAVDPDNDLLSYNYVPKSPYLSIEGGTLLMKTKNGMTASSDFPRTVTMSVTDGSHVLRRTVSLIANRSYLQPDIGDFTRKIFSEGDSIVTYLNIDNAGDLKHIDVKFNDLSLPPGINSLASRLLFEKKSSYLKIYSKGILPYNQVDRDYTYSLGVTVISNEQRSESSFKVLELSIEDRHDPTDLGHKKDSLLSDVSRYIRTESYYANSLEKVYKRISRPWWKKVAAITGTLSGILVLVQTQDQNKSVSFASAGVSLLAIMVANIPNLSEKAMSDLNDKIAGSKSRISRVQDKESEFQLSWSYDSESSNFDKMKNELESLVRKGREKRAQDICSILSNEKMKRRIERLIKQKAVKQEGAIDPGRLFQCKQ